ncbi:hypothetical protein G7046_g1395 [Stylonectria norvegica]|nr:hypothetical protein G7046_g1395 [Stylonectria norvegica]
MPASRPLTGAKTTHSHAPPIRPAEGKYRYEVPLRAGQGGLGLQVHLKTPLPGGQGTGGIPAWQVTRSFGGGHDVDMFWRDPSAGPISISMMWVDVDGRVTTSDMSVREAVAEAISRCFVIISSRYFGHHPERYLHRSPWVMCASPRLRGCPPVLIVGSSSSSPRDDGSNASRAGVAQLRAPPPAPRGRSLQGTSVLKSMVWTV